ncbi:hypothetical protein BCR32DRAFT_292631 [Anaeromyces robustus]|uniref:Scaffoldin n=1 Tax=Anaeromyces robustus TaxID=1754192 RepID=A0A1Y1X9Q2_9FUNG|nr:hypothetical protein BCR32DRAFT_292631 [Anaeromyces robustus]|eukprot:ORX82473.1 hypothetical protein BCR32DRAFT_292631 [Anaeromyces robustus]
MNKLIYLSLLGILLSKSFSLYIRDNDKCVPTYENSKLTLSSDCDEGYYLVSDGKAITSSTLNTCQDGKSCNLYFCQTKESKSIECQEAKSTNGYILFELKKNLVLKCSDGICNVLSYMGYFINGGYDKQVNTVIMCNIMNKECEYYLNEKIQNDCAYSKVGGVVRIEDKLYFCSSTNNKDSVEISADSKENYKKINIDVGSYDPFADQVLTNSRTYLVKVGNKAMVIVPEGTTEYEEHINKASGSDQNSSTKIFTTFSILINSILTLIVSFYLLF